MTEKHIYLHGFKHREHLFFNNNPLNTHDTSIIRHMGYNMTPTVNTDRQCFLPHEHADEHICPGLPLLHIKAWGKWNEWGVRTPLCTCRLNWIRKASWWWWDERDDTALQTQDYIIYLVNLVQILLKLYPMASKPLDVYNTLYYIIGQTINNKHQKCKKKVKSKYFYAYIYIIQLFSCGFFVVR